MAVVTCNGVLPNTAQKTDFYGLVNTATVSAIQGADISSSANIPNSALATLTQAGLVNTSALTGQIANSNLAQLTTAALVTGAALTLLPNILSGAGLIPAANVGSLFGSWVSKSAGTTYQALTDGIVTCYRTDSFTLTGYTDSNSSPTTERAFAQPGAGAGGSITFPVRKNDYYEVTSAGGSPTMFFIAVGS